MRGTPSRSRRECHIPRILLPTDPCRSASAFYGASNFSRSSPAPLPRPQGIDERPVPIPPCFHPSLPVSYIPISPRPYTHPSAYQPPRRPSQPHAPASHTPQPVTRPSQSHAPASHTPQPVTRPSQSHAPASHTPQPVTRPSQSHAPASHTPQPVTRPSQSHAPASRLASSDWGVFLPIPERTQHPPLSDSRTPLTKESLAPARLSLPQFCLHPSSLSPPPKPRQSPEAQQSSSIPYPCSQQKQPLRSRSTRCKAETPPAKQKHPLPHVTAAPWPRGAA